MFPSQVYEYYTSPPEPKERVRTMETLNMSVRSMTTTDDVYEAYVKPKDVKHKWVQTEDFEQGNGQFSRDDYKYMRRVYKSPNHVLINYPFRG